MKLIPTVLAVSCVSFSLATAQKAEARKADAPTNAKAKNASAPQDPARKIGYDNTPFLPNSKWRVHDGSRPQPRIVTPGTASTADKPGKAPSDAIVLFDGKSLAKWTGRKDKANWKLDKGHMEVNGTGEIRTRESFGSCQLHVEWATPAVVKGHGQGRGNSGIFLMGRYEVQVLDNFNNRTYPDGQAASLYGQKPPLVNAARKPGEWQTYDILFTAPRFKDKKLVSPGYVTVIHNGVVVQNHEALLGSSTHKRVAKYSAHGKGPIKLQDHGNPTRYRNIWLRKLD